MDRSGNRAFDADSGSTRFGRPDGTEAMRIDSSGNVIIGTQSQGGDRILSLRGDSAVLGYDSSATAAVVQSGNVKDLKFCTGTDTFGDNERMRLDSSGNLLVGKTSPDVSVNGFETGDNGYTKITRTSGTANVNTVLELNRLSTDGEILRLQKDGTTVGSIGSYIAYMYIGSTGGVDTHIGFVNGTVRPATATGGLLDNALDLGSSGARWDDIYATNGTINTSDRNEKQDISELSEAEQRVAVAAKGLLRKFRWKDSVAEKGDEARIHFGIIAQDLQDAFTAEGLDAGRYAMFISTTWTDEETGEERTRMGVRYSELLAFIIAAI